MERLFFQQEVKQGFQEGFQETKMTCRRARSTARPYRDPMIDDLTGMLEEWKPRAKVEVEVTPRQALQALIMDALGEPCFICDGSPDVVRIYFVPEELAKANQKVIFYSLCRICAMDISTPKKVKEILTAQLREENKWMGVS